VKPESLISTCTRVCVLNTLALCPLPSRLSCDFHESTPADIVTTLQIKKYIETRDLPLPFPAKIYKPQLATKKTQESRQNKTAQNHINGDILIDTSAFRALGGSCIGSAGCKSPLDRDFRWRAKESTKHISPSVSLRTNAPWRECCMHLFRRKSGVTDRLLVASREVQ
jgi:hypothetical protein